MGLKFALQALSRFSRSVFAADLVFSWINLAGVERLELWCSWNPRSVFRARIGRRRSFRSYGSRGRLSVSRAPRR